MAAAAAESWIKATGVPLLEAMKQMTLQQAAVHSGGLIAATVVGVVAGLRLLELVGEQVRRHRHRHKQTKTAGMFQQ